MWRYEYNNHGNGSFAEWWTIIDEDDDLIATIYSEEDACLIATSPELLELLENVLRRLDLEPAEAIFPCSAMREEIRAAIAKARGK